MNALANALSGLPTARPEEIGLSRAALQRLSGAAQSCFIAWFEGHGEAVAIAPSCRPGTEFHDQINLAEILSRIQSTG